MRSETKFFTPGLTAVVSSFLKEDSMNLNSLSYFTSGVPSASSTPHGSPQVLSASSGHSAPGGSPAPPVGRVPPPPPAGLPRGATRPAPVPRANVGASGSGVPNPMALPLVRGGATSTAPGTSGSGDFGSRFGSLGRGGFPRPINPTPGGLRNRSLSRNRDRSRGRDHSRRRSPARPSPPQQVPSAPVCHQPGSSRAPPSLIGSRLRDAREREDPSGSAYFTYSSVRTNHPPSQPTLFEPLFDPQTLPLAAARLGVRSEFAHLLRPSMVEELNFIMRYGRQTWEHLIGGRAREARAHGEEIAPWFCIDLVRAMGIGGFHQGFLNTTPLDLIPGRTSSTSLPTYLALVHQEAVKPDEQLVIILCDGQRAGFRLVNSRDFVSARIRLVQDASSDTGHSIFIDEHGAEDAWTYAFRAPYDFLLEDILGGETCRGRLRPGYRVVQVVLEG